MLGLMTPGGGEGFFIELGRQPTHDGIPDAGPVDVAALRRVGEKYGDEVVGPPLSARP